MVAKVEQAQSRIRELARKRIGVESVPQWTMTSILLLNFWRVSYASCTELAAEEYDDATSVSYDINSSQGMKYNVVKRWARQAARARQNGSKANRGWPYWTLKAVSSTTTHACTAG